MVPACELEHWKGYDNANALCPFHYVSIRDDVSVRVDNYARAHRMLANDSRRIDMAMRFCRPISVNEDLDDSRGNFRDHLLKLKRAVQFSQQAGAPGGQLLGRSASVLSWPEAIWRWTAPVRSAAKSKTNKDKFHELQLLSCSSETSGSGSVKAANRLSRACRSTQAD